MNNDTNNLSTTTAIEVAKLATELVTDFPDVLNVTKLTSYQFSFKDTKVFNTNKMIYSLNKNIKLQGVDGLQTSFSTNGNYSFVSTAKRGDTRLISVILDAENENSTFIETKSYFSTALILLLTLHSKRSKMLLHLGQFCFSLKI